MGSVLDKVGGIALVAGAAIAAAGAAITGVVKSAAAAGDNVDKMSQKIGISRVAFQEWDFILSQAGTDIGGLQMGIKTLSKAAYEAAQGVDTYADSFDALGISVLNTDGSLKDQEALFNETILALSAMEDRTKRTALASELLGRSATELAPLLNSGADAVTNMRQQAHDLGLVLGDEVIDSGVVFTDTMDQIKRALKSIMTNLGAGAMPMFQKFSDWIVENMPKIQEVMSGVFGKIESVVTGAINVFKNKLLPILIKLYEWITPKLPAIKEFFVNAFTAIFGVLRKVVNAIKDAVLPELKKLWAWIEPKLPAIKQLFINTFEKATEVILIMVDAIKSATRWIKDHWAIVQPIFAGIAAGALAFKIITGAIAAYNIIVGIATAASGAFSAAIAFISGPIGIIIIAIGALVAAGIFLYKNWDEVSAFLIQAWEDIKDFAVDLWASLKDIFMNKIPYALGYLVGYVAAKIPEIIDTITTFFEELPAKAGEWIGKTISKIINMLPEAVGAAKGFGKGILEGIMGFITSIPAKIGATVDKIKGFFGNIFGKASEGATAGIEAARIPGAAQGGIVETAGSVWVGEQGAELLTLPKAASIAPLPTGKNIIMNINNPKFFSQRDMDKMMDNAVRRINLKVG